MRQLFYNVPTKLTLQAEKLTKKISDLTNKFQAKIDDYNDKKGDRRIALIKSRKWKYEIKTLDDGWRILYKSSDIIKEIGWPMAEEWSEPFKIENRVLFHRKSNYYRDTSFFDGTARIPQGLLPEGTDDVTLTGQYIGW